MTAITCVLILAAADSPADALASIRSVGPGATGSSEAASAWKELIKSDPAMLPEILAGFDGASPLARNWLRSAVSAIAERNDDLPLKDLEAFVLDQSHDGEARYLAYELIRRSDKAAESRLLPKLLDDPGAELRRDAVAKLIAEADKLVENEKKTEALTTYRKAFEAARDQRQVVGLAQKLKGLDAPVDLPNHLALITKWKLIGPFAYDPDKPEPTYPPEKGVDPTAKYDGKDNKSIGWIDHTTEHEFGIVDLNKALAPGIKQVGYAYTEFMSDAEKEVQIRLGCFTKFQLWLNNKLVLDRADAYTGMRLDHYPIDVKINKGKNTILLKVYQDDPPPQLPSKNWHFLLRVCTPDGVGILSTDRTKE